MFSKVKSIKQVGPITRHYQTSVQIHLFVWIQTHRLYLLFIVARK